jgi:hypothetical protein
MNLDYVAGIIDGEGYVGICPNTSKYRSFVGKIQVSMATPILPKALQKQFGGSYSTHRRLGKNQRDAYTWQISGRNALYLIALIKDKVILKKSQMSWIEKLYKNKDSAPARNHPTEAQMARQREIWLACKALNKRGK